MEETKGTKPQTEDAPTTRTREEQATSSKTLSDLEETQSDALTGTGKTSESGSPTETSSPSPDGAFDSPRGGRADGSDTGGPM